MALNKQGLLGGGYSCPQTPTHPFCWLLAGGVSIGNVLPAADITQFKQGVKSVAGKMAVLANGVMNSLQVRQGCSSLWPGVGVWASYLLGMFR